MNKMKKQLITIILICALTLTGFTALTMAPVNADSSDAEILSYTWYAASNNNLATYAGDLVVVGELQNVGTTNIFAVYVLATAFINDSEVAYASPHQMFANNLEPGQKAPFYLDFLPENSLTGDLSWVANVTNVVVYTGYLENTDLDMYQGLTVTSQNQTSSGVYQIIGSVSNTGTETIGDVRVVTTFYDASGTVVSLNYTEVLSDALAPGSSMNFVATPVDNYPAGNITSYSTLVQSTPVEPETTTNPTSTPTPTATSTPTATATATPTQTPDQSSQDYTLIILAVVVLVVVIGVVAVLFTRGKRGKTEQAPLAQ
jgi:flagellar basal body-associated protein FliL